MNQYEGMFIINPTLDTPTVRKTITEIQDIMTREGGKIVSVEEWGRRKLAYQVRKHADGHYVLVNFDLAPDKVARIRGLFILNELIMRFILLRRVPRPAVADKPREEAGYESALAAN